MEKEPKDLDEVVDMLIQEIEAQKATETVKESGIPHHGAGTSIRNSLGLWWQESWVEEYGRQKPPLVEWFNQKQIFHADDMSGTIAAAVKAKLAGEPFDVDAHIKRYHEHWARLDKGDYSF